MKCGRPILGLLFSLLAVPAALGEEGGNPALASSLSTDKPAFVLGEPVDVRIEFANGGGKDLVTGRTEAEEPWRNLAIFRIEAGGKVPLSHNRPCPTRGPTSITVERDGMQASADFAWTIRAGGTIAVIAKSLGCYYQMDEGRYEVRFSRSFPLWDETYPLVNGRPWLPPGEEPPDDPNWGRGVVLAEEKRVETEAAPLVFEITRPEGLPPGEVGRIRRAMALFRSLDLEPLKAMLAADRKGEEASAYARACVRFWAGEAAILENCAEEGSYDHLLAVVRGDPEGAFAPHALRRMLWLPANFPRIVAMGEPAVAPLIRALKDPEAAPAAAKALKQITGKDFGASFEKWSEWRRGRGK